MVTDAPSEQKVTIKGEALACLLLFLLRKNKRSTYPLIVSDCFSLGNKRETMVSQRETIKGLPLHAFKIFDKAAPFGYPFLVCA